MLKSKHTLILCLVLAILLSGCAGIFSTETAEDDQSALNTATPTAAEPEPMRTPTPTSTETATLTPTPTPTPTPIQNPWENETAVIAVSGTPDDQPDVPYKDRIGEGVEYWTDERIEKYGVYNVSFVYKPDADVQDADITIRVVDEIGECGLSITISDTLGCAPILSENDRESTVSARISKNQTAVQFRNTVSHELGHILGIEHKEKPYWLMYGNRSSQAKDARDRENPWNHSREIRVAVRDSDENSGMAHRQLERVADFYNSDDEYLPEREIVVVDNWRNADIVFQDHTPEVIPSSIPLGPFSKTFVSGLDYDHDDDFEQYSRVTVWYSDLDEQQFERHAGRWVGFYSGIETWDLPRRYQID